MTDKGRERLARLCWLVADAGASALRVTFDCFYSPMNLKKNINRLEMRNILAKLRSQGRITQAEWEKLYPSEQRNISSNKFGFDMLIVLLQNICHMSSPYPGGWSKEPLPEDKSLSADITRLKVAKDKLCSAASLSEETYQKLWELATSAIFRLGGAEAKRKIHRVESEILTTEFMQNQFIQQLQKTEEQVVEKTEVDNRSKLLKQRSSMSPFKDIPHEEHSGEGIPQEDIIVLNKTFKLLIESICVEDTLDFLQNRSVIDEAQRKRVLSIHKNAPKMRFLINIIQKSTNQQAFKLFCESIKDKYTAVYSTIVKARDQIYQQGLANKSDILGYCKRIITTRYKALYSHMTPLPWEEWTKPRDKCYVPLQIVNSHGQELSLDECFPKRSTVKVMIGPPGHGKTTLCRMLANTWAQSPDDSSTTCDLLLYLDIANTQGKSILDLIYSQIFPDGFRVSKTNFQSAIENNAEKILFVIDGFADGFTNSNVEEILRGSLYKGCSVLLMANPSCKKVNGFSSHSYVYCQGLHEVSIARCIRTYTNLVDIEDKPLNKFIASLRGNMVTIQTLRNPLLSMSVAAYNEETLPSLETLSTTTSTLHSFFQILLAHFCTDNGLLTTTGKMQEVMKQTLKKLKQRAYSDMLASCSCISSEEMEAFEVESLHKLGIFVQFHDTWTYQSSIWRDFLAAVHLAEMEHEEFTKDIFHHKLLKLSRYEQCIELLCGILSMGQNSEKLSQIFTEFVSYNRRSIRGINFVAETNDKDENLQTKRTGQFRDFAPSFRALYETRNDKMSQMLSGSMPPCMVIKSNHLFPEHALLGLSSVLRLQTANLVELDISLGKLHEFQTYSLLEMAQALGQNQHVRVLRVTWLSMNIAACFLGAVLENNTSLRQVHVDRGKGRHTMPSRDSASLWAGLQTASVNLGHLESFSFLNCPYPEVVGHVLRHLPPTLPHLNISGSAFDMVCGHRLASFLSRTKRLSFLDISEVKIGNTEFFTLVQGLKVCPTLQVMKIAQIKLGRLAFLGLCDSLILTRNIEKLDLSGCQLTDEMGTRLAQITEKVSSLKTLNLQNSEISQEGRSLIQMSSPRSLNVLGIHKGNGLPPIIGGL